MTFHIKMLVLGLALCGSAGVQAANLTHGVAAGDVTTHSAVIWSRADRTSTMHLVVWKKKGHRAAYRTSLPVKAEDDYTGKIVVTGLKPGTDYKYMVCFLAGSSVPFIPCDTGTFHTAPSTGQAAPVRFAWGGDLAGQNVCRDSIEGFPIMRAIRKAQPDFFIGLGDMIYADGRCEATGRYGNAQIPGSFDLSANMNDFWFHWKYNREDRAYRSLLGSMPYYAVWDDHEVVNDFGPLHDTRSTPPYTHGVHLTPMGLAAFLDYNPIAEKPDTPSRLYRNIRWGKHLELFILDTRQYRDANAENDSDAFPKTMLGREQLVWLKEKLKESDATWKVIVSSVPMSIPTGFPPQNGRDGWADYDQTTGFERELVDILRFMKDNGIYNNLWITTDVHFAEVFRYIPFAEDATFQVHEVVTGPLNAGLFPNRNYDTSLGTQSVFFYGPGFAAVTTWEQAKPWMNFGMAEVAENGALTLSVRDVKGTVVFQQILAARP